MEYTNQKRKELNRAFISKLNNPQIEMDEGGTHLFLLNLPTSAEEVESAREIIRNIPRSAFPWNNVLPILMKTNTSGVNKYLIGYVNSSDKSIECAVKKVGEGKVYYIPGFTLKKGTDYA